MACIRSDYLLVVSFRTKKLFELSPTYVSLSQVGQGLGPLRSAFSLIAFSLIFNAVDDADLHR